MELQFFEKTQILASMLISQALCLGHVVLHGSEALLHVLPVFAQQINCRVKQTSLKDLLRGMIFLSQLSIQ